MSWASKCDASVGQKKGVSWVTFSTPPWATKGLGHLTKGDMGYIAEWPARFLKRCTMSSNAMKLKTSMILSWMLHNELFHWRKWGANSWTNPVRVPSGPGCLGDVYWCIISSGGLDQSVFLHIFAKSRILPLTLQSREATKQIFGVS